ncbi:MAG TPA: zinc-binding dehydrogenase [Phycisphaerae bacterium]|nr:zinc-binding dehydrogenase [Phycisphaerae bacterium]
MKAMVITANGGPEVFAQRDLPIPEAGPNQLLVRVMAAGVNPLDYKLRRTGAFGYGPGSVLGFDAAGVVEKVGPGVTGFKPMDEVFYSPDVTGPGSYAQYHLTAADIVVKKPQNLTFIEAAAIPLAGMTAWQAMIDRCHMQLGQRVLIHGASGGVGSMAVQLAHTAGAYVYATASPANMGLVRGLGADYVIDRTQRDFAAEITKETDGEGVDLVFDCVGSDLVARSIPIVRSMGNIVTIVNPSGDLSLGYRKNISLHYAFMLRKRQTLEQIAELVEHGKIKPVIGKVMKLEQAAEAHKQLEQGGGFGKIVLTTA